MHHRVEFFLLLFVFQQHLMKDITTKINCFHLKYFAEPFSVNDWNFLLKYIFLESKRENLERLMKHSFSRECKYLSMPRRLFSSAGDRYPRSKRAMPERFSVEIGFFLCGIIEEPFCHTKNLLRLLWSGGEGGEFQYKSFKSS